MRLPKIITAIPIILLVLLPCIYCLYFQVNDYRIWKQMEEKLESAQLQTVIIPVAEFRWYEENREIVVHGTMFDVKSIERKGDNYIVTGLFDEAETELHIAMGWLQGREEKGEDASMVPVIISQTLIPPVIQPNIHLPMESIAGSKAIIPAEKLYNTILSIHTPPPRCI
jgi:hypothetical protein